MNNTSAPKKTAITASDVALASNGGRLDSWRSAGFFPPVAPPAPVAQPAAGRAFDFGQGFNLVSNPRRDEPGGITFQMLRNLADNYDLLRLVIETRKDQLCGMKWNIVGRNPDDKIKSTDPRVLEVEKFLRKPDKRLTWNDWLRTLVEDLLVIDAPAVYCRKTLGKGMFSLDVIDGATIKLLIDPDGRTPLAPAPAYAQVIKGMPMAHYTTEELLYKPRNRRSWKMYGMSPVEQVIMTVNIAMRRQTSQLQYYTEGNVPEALVSCPTDWNAEQVLRFQTAFDSLMQDQSEAKRHIKFVPGGMDVAFTRGELVKDSMDEWLARIICYAFSVSPQALVQMMNRATAESAAETAELEGLAPLQMWVKDFMDDIIEQHFGFDDLVFAWDDGKELDPKAQAEIHAIYHGIGALDTDEVREDIGRDPLAQRDASRAGATADGSVPPPVPADAAHGTADAGQSSDAAGEQASNPVVAAAGGGTTNEEGAPLATGATAGAGAGATGGTDMTIQDTAMNGTQVTSLLEIVTEVATKNLPPETARALINAAFPFIKSDLIDAMLNGLANFEPPPPPVSVVDADGNPVPPKPPGAGTPAAKKDGESAPKKKESGSDDESATPAPLKKARVTHAHMTPSRKKAQGELTNVMRRALSDIGEEVAKQIQKLRKEPELEKARNDDMDYIDNLLGKLNINFDDAGDGLLAALEIAATGGAEYALSKIDAKNADALDLANTRAEKWAANRAAELIGKAANGRGELAASTRDMIRSTVLEAEQEGWSNARLANELRDNYAFSKQRADTIARTETKMADSQGAIAGWRESGLKMQKEWVRSANDYDCDICEANEQQGPIDLDADFDSGDDTAPAHPNCECVVQSVIDTEQET